MTGKQQVSAYYLVKWLISYRDPDREKRDMIQKKSSAIIRRLDDNERRDGRKGGRMGKLSFSSYEQTILTDVVAPEDIHVTFNGILPIALEEEALGCVFGC